MPIWEAFTGGAYRARSQTIAAQTCVNLYPELTEAQGAAKKGVLYGTPGCKNLLTVTDGVVMRGSFSQDGRTFAVVGGAIIEITVNTATYTLLGTVANDGRPVSMASNGMGGNQLAIVSAGFLYMLNLVTNALSASIILPLTYAPVHVVYIDGYFMMPETGTVRIWYSNLLNGSIWDALDFFSRSQASDNVVAIGVLRDRVWVFGSITSQVYYDSGGASNPFLPYPGSLMQEGLTNWTALTQLGESFYWLAQDNQGTHRMVSARDYNPTVISTPAIGFAVASYTSALPEAWGYEQEGHPFVGWTFPGPNVTWCWDVREQEWHQRQSWNTTTGTQDRWLARGLSSAGSVIFCGDYATGKLYTLDLDTFTDNQGMILAERAAPYLSAENQWLFVDQVELGMQPGVGLTSGQGVAPVVMLELSEDSGQTWHPVTTATLGAKGVWTATAIWRRLGRFRGDRLVFRVTQSDPVRRVWGPGLWLRTTSGTGQL